MVKRFRRWLCVHVLGHRWGTGPGLGATCMRCGFLAAPWSAPEPLRRAPGPARRLRVTATLTDAQEAMPVLDAPVALRETARRPRAPTERVKAFDADMPDAPAVAWRPPDWASMRPYSTWELLTEAPASGFTGGGGGDGGGGGSSDSYGSSDSSASDSTPDFSDVTGGSSSSSDP